MHNSYSDNEYLIKQLNKGNEDAYAYLMQTYYKKLFVYALSLAHDHAGAEDIVQNVFLKTWEYRKRLKTKFSIKSFLYRATYNEFTNYYHKTQAIARLEQKYVEILNEVIEDIEPHKMEQQVAIIFKQIELLPKKCKQTLLLSVQEGLTNIEIAEYLNISIKTVEGHITKAYRLLRKSLHSVKT